MSYLMDNYGRLNVSFKKGKGAKLWDCKDKQYIDFASGIGVCSLGHANKKLAKVISKQARTLLHTSNIYKIAPQEGLAKKMSEFLGFETYAFFCNSGAEANEAAIKMARKYGTTKFEKKKYEILTLKNSFHGRTIATLCATGQDKFHPEIFAPYIDGFKFFDRIDEIIENIGENTVAVMIELVQGEGGIMPLDKEKVQKLAAILKEKKLLLITDEVQCGVFRTGEFVTSKIYGIEPDIITFAKGLAGGVPIGAALAKENIFAPGEHGSTFGGNFLSTSCGLSVLSELEKIWKKGALKNTIEKFEENLESIVAQYGEIFEKRVGLGLMQGLVLKDSKKLSEIFEKSLKNGLLVLKSGTNTLRFLPPLNIKNSEIKAGFKIFRKTLDEI